jgi:hypothetical protein
MTEGLNMTKEQFQGLSQTDKLNCLFENQCETIKLIRGYKLYYKITATIGSILVAGMGILFSFHLG